MARLFHKLSRKVITIFSGRNLLYHLLAIVLTILIVQSNFDWHYYCWTRAAFFAQLALPAIMLGSVIPIFGTLAVLVVGVISRRQNIVTTAWALGQSVILGYLISIF